MMNPANGQTCLSCQAAPGTAHSMYCDDPDLFNHAEGQRERLEYDAARAANDIFNARGALESAMDNARRVADQLVNAGRSEVETARMLNIDRMTVRKWLGKR